MHDFHQEVIFKQYFYLHQQLQFMFLFANCLSLCLIFFISRRALAREGDYEMMPVCACVRALVSHADSSKTTTATDFL